MTTYNHISIDLETLDNKPTSAIISIGAVAFDPFTGSLGATFYQEIDIDSAIKSGSVSGSTLAFWMQQDEKSKRVFGGKDKVGLATALDALATWVRSRDLAPKVWGNGSSFDITILEYAYIKGGVGLAAPWHYTNIRDMRTIVDAAGYNGDNWPFPRKGVHHNALDDATYQAQVISACWTRIHKALGTMPKTSPKMSEKIAKAKTEAPTAPIVPEDDEL